MKRKILVTGAGGFLGRHAVRALLGAGYSVRALARGIFPDAGNSGVEAVSASILEPVPLFQAMQGCDAVVHLAGKVSRDPRDAAELEELHVTGTRRVIESAHRAKIARVIYVSTSGTVAVSHDPRRVAVESDPYAEKITRGWPYYASKIRAEKLALKLARKLRLQLVTLNPSLLLGPGDARLSSTEDVLRFLKGGVPAYPSGGLSFTDVRDVADAVVAALRRGRAGERYLLGAANWTFKAFFTRLGELAGVDAPFFAAPDGPARFAARASAPIFRGLGIEPPLDPVAVELSQAFWYLDHAKAKKELSFRPRNPNETLWDTIEDLRARRLAA